MGCEKSRTSKIELVVEPEHIIRHFILHLCFPYYNKHSIAQDVLQIIPYQVFDMITHEPNICVPGEATWGGEKTVHADDYEESGGHPGMQGGPQCKQM